MAEHVSRGTSKRSRSAASSRSRSKSPSQRGGGDGSDLSLADQRELLPEGKLYYRIGEVSKITGIKPHVLRYWETEFRWMAPPKSRSKQRLYRRKDIEMVLAIKKLLYDERYTIAGARQVIRERGVARLLEEGVGQAPEIEAAEAVEVAGSPTESEAHDLPERIRQVRKELLALRDLLA